MLIRFFRIFLVFILFNTTLYNLNAQARKSAYNYEITDLDRYDYVISNRNSNEYNFYLACIQNNTDYINKMISNGIDVNCELTVEEDLKIGQIIDEYLESHDKETLSYTDLEDWHCSALAAATFANSLDAIKILLKNKATTEKTHYDTEYSLLEISCFTNSYETFNLLVECGLNPYVESRLIELIFDDYYESEYKQFIDFYIKNFDKIIFTSEDLFIAYFDYIDYNSEDDITFKDLITMLDKNKTVKQLFLSDELISELIGEAFQDIDNITLLLKKYPDLVNRKYNDESANYIISRLCNSDEETFNYVFNNMPKIKELLLSDDYSYKVYESFLCKVSEKELDFIFGNGFSKNYHFNNLDLSLLEFAVRNSYKTLYTYLIKNKVPVNTESKSNNILFNALLTNNPETISFIINKYNCINTTNKDGITPLIFYLENTSARIDIVKLLIEKGDDIYQKNKKFENCITIASKGWQITVKEYLIDEYIKNFIDKKFDINTFYVEENYTFLEYLISKESSNSKIYEYLDKILPLYKETNEKALDLAVLFGFPDKYIFDIIHKCSNISGKTCLDLIYFHPYNEEITNLVLKKCQIIDGINYRDLVLNKYSPGNIIKCTLRISSYKKFENGFYTIIGYIIENGKETSNSIYLKSREEPKLANDDIINATLMFEEYKIVYGSGYPYFILINPQRDLTFTELLLSSAEANSYSVKRKLNDDEQNLLKTRINELEKWAWYENDYVIVLTHGNLPVILYRIKGTEAIYVLNIETSILNKVYLNNYGEAALLSSGVMIEGYGLTNALRNVKQLPMVY